MRTAEPLSESQSSRLFVRVSLCAAFVAAAGCGAPLDVELLRERTANAAPSWNNYTEDLKAQLGATACAVWAGVPIGIRRESANIEITFTLEGPWREFSFGVPVLLMAPDGSIYRNQSCTVSQGKAVYGFKLKAEGAAMEFPWVHVRFPTGEKRLGLTEDPSDMQVGE